MWHQKHRKANHIPDGLRALDTDASWSTSKYCGWVYGYGLHLTTTANGFPRLADVWTASVSEKAGLDHKIEALSARNIRYIVADAGIYRLCAYPNPRRKRFIPFDTDNGC